jgi:hypothetical protein
LNANGRGDQQDQSNEASFLDKQFMPNMENYGPGTPQQQHQNIQNSLKCEYVTFKHLKDPSIVSEIFSGKVDNSLFIYLL